MIKEGTEELEVEFKALYDEAVIAVGELVSCIFFLVILVCVRWRRGDEEGDGGGGLGNVGTDS